MNKEAPADMGRIETTTTTTVESPTSDLEVELWQTEDGSWRSRTFARFVSTEATPEEIQLEISQLLRIGGNAAKTEIHRRERADIIEEFHQSTTQHARKEVPNGHANGPE